MGDTTLGVRCDDLTVNFRGDDILTLERVVGFCEYENKIIDTYETWQVPSAKFQTFFSHSEVTRHSLIQFAKY